MPNIHPTAIVHPNARIAETVTVDAYAVIREDVSIDEGTSIGPHCLLDNGARIGKNCKIHQGAILATPPQDLKYKNEKTELFVGDNTTVREYCTLNRGTTHSFKTVIGNNCLFMAYVHIPHDGVIGNNVIMGNSVQIGGHSIVGDFAIIGGLTGLHQFSHVGAHTMVGACVFVQKDVPPYALAGHSPLRFEGLNSIGLRRRGFPKETLAQIEKAYHLLYYSGKNITSAVDEIKSTMELIPEVQAILDFIGQSKRGIIKPYRGQ